MRPPRRRRLAAAAAVLAAVALGGLSAALADGPWLASPIGHGESPAAPWHVVGLPNQTKPLTRFSVVPLDGARVLKIETASSYGNLVHATPGHPPAHGLSWRWRLDLGLLDSDLRRRAGDDSPAKVCALYDLPIDAVPFIERQLLKLARSHTTELLPAATVCYVWDAHLAPGTVLDNAYSRRIRMVVVRGPETPLHTWVDERRDLQADFLHLFGDEARSVPPLLGIAIAADADNTLARSLAHLSSIALD